MPRGLDGARDCPSTYNGSVLMASPTHVVAKSLAIEAHLASTTRA